MLIYYNQIIMILRWTIGCSGSKCTTLAMVLSITTLLQDYFQYSACWLVSMSATYFDVSLPDSLIFILSTVSKSPASSPATWMGTEVTISGIQTVWPRMYGLPFLNIFCLCCICLCNFLLYNCLPASGVAVYVSNSAQWFPFYHILTNTY